MKCLFLLSLVCISTVLTGTSCSKDNHPKPVTPTVERTVQFVLFTDKDFSTDHKQITFKLSIQNPAANTTLWDSTLAPMAISDIPDIAHKLVVEKLVPNNDPSLLKVGFYYTIENVGNSWHLDSLSVGQTFKIVDFNFQ